MKRIIQSLPPIIRITMTLISALILLIGCSGIESPVSSQNSSSNHDELWTPNAGDEIIPGQDIPILDPGYWDNLYGPGINPFRIAPSSNLIDEDMGGTVSLGYHSYYVPADAIHADFNGTIAYASFNAIGVDCGPSPFTFDAPVTLTLSYRGTQYERSDSAPDLHIFWINPRGEYIMMDSRVDHSNFTVTCETDHFSRYIIG